MPSLRLICYQVGLGMSLEDALHAIANAINRLADVHAPTAEIVPKSRPAETQEFIINMDDAGAPSKFKNRCSVCGELGVASWGWQVWWTAS